MSEPSAPVEAARAKLQRPLRPTWSPRAALAASTLAALSALLLAAAVILGPGIDVDPAAGAATVFAR